jgi:hypothetical protein
MTFFALIEAVGINPQMIPSPAAGESAGRRELPACSSTIAITRACGATSPASGRGDRGDFRAARAYSLGVIV